MPTYTMDSGVIDRITMLQKDGHPRAVPVFGGAAFAYTAIHQEIPDIDAFLDYLENAVKMSRFWGYTDATEVARIFCELCLVDPMLYGIR